MRSPHRLIWSYSLIVMTLLTGSGCAVRKIVIDPPKIAFQTETYVVIQTGPDCFTVLTRSKAAIDEINKRLGCTKGRVCAGQWNGEVWTIQRHN